MVATLAFSVVDVAEAAAPSTAQKNDFISSVVSPAQKAQKAWGIPASVSIAEAIQDSNYGTSTLATKAKNVFNVACASTTTPAQFAKVAEAQVGKPYIYGAEASITNSNPKAFDCSELVQWVFGRSGNTITDLAAAQYNVTVPVKSGESPRPGDLVFLRNNPARSNGIGHVALLTKKLSNGDWQIIEAKGRAYGVVKSSLSTWKKRSYYAGLRRYPSFVLAGDQGVALVSVASPYQDGCYAVTTSGKTTRYRKYSSLTDAFADHALTVAKEPAYAAAREVATNVNAYVDAIAKVKRPSDAAAYAKALKSIISSFGLTKYDTAPLNLLVESGDSGTKVSALQYLLRQSDTSVKVTGKFDSATVSGVKKFQKARKLEVDGQVGPLTLTALLADLKAGANQPRVSALHTLLSAAGYTVSAGQVFSATDTASVKAFQASVGLGATGTVDAKTWSRLFMTLDPVKPPTVSGVPTYGQKLTAAIGGWGPGTVTYRVQWYRGATAIPGASASTYSLQPADVGQPITVKVTGSQLPYTPVTRASAATAKVAPAKLTATPTPTVAGTAKAGEVLTATPGTWAPATTKLTYQWYRGATAVKGATAPTYRLQPADVGQLVKVTVTGSLAGYATVTTASQPTVKVIDGILKPTPTPVIKGAVRVGSTVEAVPGTWGTGPVTYTYQWYLGKTPIKGATAKTYTILPANAGQALSVTVKGVQQGFQPVWRGSAAATVTKGVITPAPTPLVRGPRSVGETLKAQTATWGKGQVKLTYQWYRGKSVIKGATAATYKVGTADIGYNLSVRVSGWQSGYDKVTKSSAQTAKIPRPKLATPSPKITGTVKAGSKLTVDTTGWGPVKLTYAYQWYRGLTKIKGATKKTYTLAKADFGHTLTVLVHAEAKGYAGVNKTAVLKIK